MNTCLAINSFALRLGPSTPAPLLLYELSFSRRKQGSSASHVRIIARQRRPLGPETSTGPCLTPQNREICRFIMCRTCPPGDLRIRDVGFHELLRKSSLIYFVEGECFAQFVDMDPKFVVGSGVALRIKQRGGYHRKERQKL